MVRYLNAMVPWPYPEDGALHYLQAIALPAIARGEEWHWSLRLKSAPEQMIGNISLMDEQDNNRGFWLAPPWQGQGYMREAILSVVHHAFTVMDLSRIEAACLPENVASRGVLEKSGFKYEGVAQSYLQINNRWRNHVLYANLRNDRRGRTDIG